MGKCDLCLDKCITDVHLLDGGDWLAGIDGQAHWSREPELSVCGVQVAKI